MILNFPSSSAPLAVVANPTIQLKTNARITDVVRMAL
jgi:hypothetical protein